MGCRQSHGVEQSHSHKAEEGSKRLEATVVTLTADSILLDIGFKTEGILPLAALPAGETVKPTRHSLKSPLASVSRIKS